MLHELLPLLPDRLTGAPSDLLAWSAAVGLLLGLFGARFSRSQLTLAAVALGAWIGLRLPAMLHWSIDPMSPGVAGAIVFGTVAYLLHRTLVALALGAVLSLWTLAGTWINRGGGTGWDPSGLHWTGETVSSLAQLWHSLPGDLGTKIPWFCGAALASGILAGVLWPRLSRCMLYSVAGSTLAVVTALPLAARLRPEWLQWVPVSAAAQGIILAAWVGLCLLVQWRFSAGPAQGSARLARRSPPGRAEASLVAKAFAPQSPATTPFAKRGPIASVGASTMVRISHRAGVAAGAA